MRSRALNPIEKQSKYKNFGLNKEKVDKKKLRYLFAYGCWREGIAEKYERLLERLRRRGYYLEGFCVTLDPPGPWINYPMLNRLWKRRDRKLLHMYKKLEKKLQNFDVFILHNGANIHQEFLKRISTFNVYICFDDPESSDVLSKPVAKYFDIALTGNIACINLYKSWGVKNADFIPLGFTEDDYYLKMTEDEIINKNRDIDILFLGERESPWRQDRLDKLIKAFPDIYTRGRGWPAGYLPEEQRVEVYQRSKIGINVHNSVGPVNLRTYMLPANGVMQVCDNKHMLGYLFKLGEEVVGYDSIDEGIELIKYYLEHDDERKQIAVNGWKRALKDYSIEVVWEKLTNKISPLYQECKKNMGEAVFQVITLNEKDSENFGNKIKKSLKKNANRFLNHYGYEIRKKDKPLTSSSRYGDIPVLPYLENPEMGAINWEEKEKRVKEGRQFEWTNIIVLNQAVVTLLGDMKKIIEVGSGTGCFAWHAAMDKTRHITASEMNVKAKEWAIRNRSAENIKYVSKWLNEFEADSFNVVVAIEVIEHVKDYSSFLKELSRIAPKSIITTPNKNRDKQSAKMSPPQYYCHVREWTAGEFYWVLKVFYNDVKLYSMPNIYLPYCVPINITSRMTPLIAVCE